MSTAEFWGHNRVGTSVTGRIGDKAVSTFVESCFRSRWRDLRVDRDGIEVGHIGPHPDSGKRVWWAEGPKRFVEPISFRADTSAAVLEFNRVVERVVDLCKSVVP